jgi:probable phosphoglycerate mutase
MQITLIRHLPTEWNKKTWLQGRRDISLLPPTDQIQKKIKTNQQLLKELSPFDIVLASTLKRTQQTSFLYGYQAETDELLDELDFGPFEGAPKEILLATHRDEWIENPKALVLGESLQNLEDRIRVFLDKYREYKNVLVFGHGSWIRALLSFLKFGDINAMNKMTVQNNECITIAMHAASPGKKIGGFKIVRNVNL